MMKDYGAVLLLTFLVANLHTTDAEARFFRTAKVPNAVANCNTCHINGGGTARNLFGLDVEALVTPNGQEVFWGPELAALDSDDDGFTNGEELGDPDGTWLEGDPSPGDSADLGNPANPDIVPNLPESEPEPTVVEESSWGAIKQTSPGLMTCPAWSCGSPRNFFGGCLFVPFSLLSKINEHPPEIPAVPWVNRTLKGCHRPFFRTRSALHF